MTDVIETLAKALVREFYETVQYEDLHPDVKHDFDTRAARLLAQIAPTLRAEGMEMVLDLPFPRDWRDRAESQPRHGFMRQRLWSDGFNSCRDAIRAEIKRMREGGEG